MLKKYFKEQENIFPILKGSFTQKCSHNLLTLKPP